MTRLTRCSEPSPARRAVVTEALEGRTLFSATAVAVGEAPAAATPKLMEVCATGSQIQSQRTFQIISAGSNGPF